MSSKPTLTPDAARARLAELLDLGGRPDELRVARPPRVADPRWSHLVRPDGGHRRVATSSLRALERRGMIRLVEHGPWGRRYRVEREAPQ